MVYRYPQKAIIKNSTSKLAQGVDVRGDGGQFVVSPSRHVSGKTYDWVNYDEEVAEANEELLDFILSKDDKSRRETEKRFGQKVGSGSVAKVPKTLDAAAVIEKGGRDTGSYGRACQMVRYGWSEDSILAALIENNEETCNPPLPARDLRRIVTSAMKNDPDERAIAEVKAIIPPTLTLGMTRTEMRRRAFAPPEYIVYGLGRGEVGLLAAKTNVGKSTLMRNATIALTTGMAYLNIIDAAEPKRVLLFDFEARWARLDKDLERMESILNEDQRRMLGENLKVVADAMVGGHALTLSNEEHRKVIKRTAQEFKADLLIVDTLAAAFTVRDENSNAEVTDKILKPMMQLARETNSGVLLVHHIGKTSEDGNGADRAYKARGASAFGAYCVMTLNLLTRRENNVEFLELGYGKVKDAKRDDLYLNLDDETRWFTASDERMPLPATEATYARVLHEFSETMPTARKVVLEAVSSEGINKSTVDRIVTRGKDEGHLRPAGYGKHVRVPLKE